MPPSAQHYRSWETLRLWASLLYCVHVTMQNSSNFIPFNVFPACMDSDGMCHVHQIYQILRRTEPVRYLSDPGRHMPPPNLVGTLITYPLTLTEFEQSVWYPWATGEYAEHSGQCGATGTHPAWARLLSGAGKWVCETIYSQPSMHHVVHELLDHTGWC